MKWEDWLLFVILVISCIIGCGGTSDSTGDYQEINRSVNGVAL